jgi:hypothetical protein
MTTSEFNQLEEGIFMTGFAFLRDQKIQFVCIKTGIMFSMRYVVTDTTLPMEEVLNGAKASAILAGKFLSPQLMEFYND